MAHNSSVVCVILSLLLAGCANMPASPKDESKDEVRVLALLNDQDTYFFKDVGHNILSEYGTVIKVRDVDIFIPDPNSSKPENATHVPGIEYTVVTKINRLITIAQYKNATDRVFRVGSHVLVQSTGSYQRILDASGLPKAIKRPPGVSFDE